MDVIGTPNGSMYWMQSQHKVSGAAKRGSNLHGGKVRHVDKTLHAPIDGTFHTLTATL